MRRRLLLVLLALLTALLGALEVPLAQMYAAGLTQKLFIEHLGHAQRFAALADPILRNKRELQAVEYELEEYRRVTPGVQVSVFDINGVPVPGVANQHPSRRSRAAAMGFLAEGSPARARTAWPGRTAPLVVGATVGGTRGPPIGAVVLEVPTDGVRDRVLVRILMLAGAGLGVLLLTSMLCALPLARWVLRPVHDLNATADRLAAGGLGARASEHSGPPELRGLARAFNEMADNLALALQRQRAFVADASHELRNPLATLRLRLEALAGHVRAQGRRDLRLALGESDRLAHVIDRLLELARAEATAAERIDFDVVSLTEERVQAWEPALEAVGSSVRLDAAGRAMSRSSPEALQYALDVLLDNAAKFAPGAVIDVTITSPADGVTVTVRDDGPGLPAEELGHVGERFWRSAGHRAVAGTGLGLATARTLLESAGATLNVTAADGGLRVELRLPPPTGPPADTSAPRPDADAADTWQSPSAR